MTDLLAVTVDAQGRRWIRCALYVGSGNVPERAYPPGVAVTTCPDCTGTGQTHRFRNDTQTRKRLMVPENFQHPAKGQLGMWALMVERYSQPGDLVLDPMAGSGATLLAALMGRSVICVELEQHFVEPMRQSWQKMRTMPMLGFEMGQAVILRGDARCLPLPDASVGTAITIPPYEGVADSTKNTNTNDAARGFPTKPMTYTSKPVDAIVSSPPYEGMEHHDNRSQDPEAIAKRADLFGKASGQNFNTPGRLRTIARAYGGYTRPVDAIVTSPSYGGTNIGRTESLGEAPFGGPNSQARGMAYAAGDRENIGNMRNAAYWDAMRLVYQECFRVLRPGGIMALVLKGFTRDGLYVDLPGQTEAMLLEAGWVKHDHWRRELWSLSLWRILQKRRDPAAWDDRLMYEEVLAFKKERP